MNSAFPIIGIGASAGGIDALRTFFSALPAHPGAALVVIVHMPPEHRTLLSEVLSALTSLPVETAVEGMAVEADHVYVSPSDAYLTLADGHFCLLCSRGSSLHYPIDRVFESLAEQAGGMAVGVILSGAGTDGTVGARAIALAGGRIFAQEPETAAHQTMPRQVAAAIPGCQIAPPDRLPEQILAALGSSDPTPDGDALERILSVVKEKTGRDFSGYKPRTLLRRIARRMDFLQFTDAQAYLSRLQSDPAEAAILGDFLVIGVTEFFRDADLFTFLSEQALPELLRKRGGAERVRGWVAGCSTGEEAYSLAITLLELAEASDRRWELKVFATDIDTAALEVARAGFYEHRALQALSPQRLSRYFEPEPDGYRAGKRLRECVVFSVHNLLSDPPFSHLDLVSCRNVLIYLNAARQATILPLFHYALDPGGLLVLGPSETVGRFEHGFESLSKKWRVFRKLPVKLPVRLNPPSELTGVSEPPRAVSHHIADHLGGSIGQMIRDVVASDFAPAVVAVDRGGHIVHYSGPIARFLALPTGPANHTLAAMVRVGLRRAVRSLFEKVWDAPAERPISSSATLRGSSASVVRVSAKRIGKAGTDGPLAILVFEDRGPVVTARVAEGAAADDDGAALRELELELEDVRGELQANIEALVTSNEELRTSNEEVLSTNEELQATNEELETSKEEIQSVNEELTSVNTQLGMKVEELAKANDDMANLLACTDVSTVFLDHDLCIQHYTPAASRLFRLIRSDLGRPLTDVVWQFEDGALLSDIALVLDKLTPREAMAHNAAGQHFIRRVAPYRSRGNQIGGVVLTFIDVTEIQTALATLRKRAHQRDLTARLSAQAFVTIDPLEFVDRILVGLCDVLGSQICHFFAHEEGGQLVLRRARGWPKTALGSTAAPDTDIARAFLDGGTVLSRDFRADSLGHRPAWNGGAVMGGLAMAVPGPVRPYGVIGAYADKADFIDADAVQWVEIIVWLLGMAFERNATEAALRNTSKVFMESRDPIIIENGEGAVVDLNDSAEAFFGWPRRQLIGKPMAMLFAEDAGEVVLDHSGMTPALRSRQTILVTADGRRMPVLRSVSALGQTESHGRTYASIFTDISPMKLAEAKLQEARQLAEQTSAEKTRFLSAVSHDLRQPLQALRLLMDVLSGTAEGQTNKIVGHMNEALTAAEGQLAILMDVTALETGQVQAHLTEVDVGAVLKTVASTCGPEAVAKGIVLKVHPGRHKVLGDHLLLERMVRNLVTNAIRHTETGKVLIGCRRRGQRLHIEVWDTGPGIPEDKQVDIFEDFFQLGNPERDRRKGYGLGLSIVGRLAKMLGYGVNIHSKVGRGTAFIITIPC